MFKTNLKTIKKITATAIFALVLIPTLAFAGSTGTYGTDVWNGGSNWSSWGSGSPTYSYNYTPTYSTVRPSTSYAPSYGSSFSPFVSYGAGIYTTPSFSGSFVGGGNYGVPAAAPVRVTNTNTNNNTATASSSATATAINNVYVYTNPSGNAVVHNPQHQTLNVYCVITPGNARLGQTVTATAYATGGIGDYQYTWGGDIYTATGPSTTFTSYTTGTKNINVTVRSGQEVITRSCNVVFENGNVNNNNNLSAMCYANPTNAAIGQVVTWSVSASGGTGAYSYTWSGSDNLTGFNQYVGKQYYTTGLKNAFVTVTSNGVSVTANCSTNIVNTQGTSFTGGSSVNLTPNITTGTPVSGVFLGDLPATGLSLSFVHYMIGFMMMILAAVFTFIYQARKRLIVENA